MMRDDAKTLLSSFVCFQIHSAEVAGWMTMQLPQEATVTKVMVGVIKVMDMDTGKLLESCIYCVAWAC